MGTGVSRVSADTRRVSPGYSSGVRSLDRRVTMKRLARRVLDRARGDLNIDRLVAQGLSLGRDVFVARGAYLDPGRPWLISIDDGSVVGPFAVILVHDAAMRIQLGYTRVAAVSIGKRVFIGAGAVVLPGSQIGDDSVIGAGALVHGKIPPRSIVVGTRSTVIKDVDSMLEFHRQAIASSQTWPLEGWTIDSGITSGQKRAQQQALANGDSGYMIRRRRARADSVRDAGL